MIPKSILSLLSLALTFSVIHSAGAEGEKTVKSKELSTAFASLIGDMVVEQKKRTGEFPEGATRPEFAISKIKELEKLYPNIFNVSESQEKRFAAGDYDDDANNKAMEQRIEDLGTMIVVVPSFHLFLMEKFGEDELSGAKLEFAVRLLNTLSEEE